MKKTRLNKTIYIQFSGLVSPIITKLINHFFYAFILLYLVIGISLFVYADPSFKNFDSQELVYNVGGIDHKFELPKDISESKDCKRFLDWQIENVIPIAEYKRCPWLDYNSLLNITIGSRKFSIPRKHLSEIYAIKGDGEVDHVVIDIEYSKAPSPENTTKKASVAVSDISFANDLFKKSGLDITIDEYIQKKYWPSEIKKILGTGKYERKYVGEDVTLSMSHYVLKSQITDQGKYKKNNPMNKFLIHEDMDTPYIQENHIYIKGDINNPTSYSLCDDEAKNINPHCKTVFLDEGLFYEVFALKEFLGSFDSIKSDAITLMKSSEIK